MRTAPTVRTTTVRAMGCTSRMTTAVWGGMVRLFLRNIEKTHESECARSCRRGRVDNADASQLSRRYTERFRPRCAPSSRRASEANDVVSTGTDEVVEVERKRNSRSDTASRAASVAMIAVWLVGKAGVGASGGRFVEGEDGRRRREVRMRVAKEMGFVRRESRNPRCTANELGCDTRARTATR